MSVLTRLLVGIVLNSSSAGTTLSGKPDSSWVELLLGSYILSLLGKLLKLIDLRMEQHSKD